MKYHLIFFYVILSVVIISCETGSITKKEGGMKTTDIKEKKEQIIPSHLYLSLDEIIIGKTWSSEDGKEFFYRILFASVEESIYIYVELLQIQEDGPVKFVARKKLLPEQFGVVYFGYTPRFIKWNSPTEIKIEVEKKQFDFDLGSLFKPCCLEPSDKETSNGK